MILLFQNKNVLAKFNYTHKNLSDYVDFLRIKTGKYILVISTKNRL